MNNARMANGQVIPGRKWVGKPKGLPANVLGTLINKIRMRTGGKRPWTTGQVWVANGRIYWEEESQSTT